MIQKLRYILLILAALIGGESWAQTTSYVLNESAARGWSTIDDSGNYIIDGPGKTLTFDAKRTAILGVTNSDEFYAEYSTDGGNNWSKVLTINLPSKDKWYSFSCEIPENANRIRMKTYFGATGKKQICNVKVTRATTLSMSSTPNA